MRKLLIILLSILLVSTPVQSGKRYLYDDPSLNSEIENIYLELGKGDKRFWEVRNAKKFKSIQEALDDLPETGGMVFVPAGTHTITSTITMKSNQALVGAGSSSIITTMTADMNLIDVVGVNVSPDDYRQVMIANLQLKNIDSGTGSGIRLRRVHHIWMKNLYITKCKYGIYFDVEANYDADNNIISNCNFYDNFYAGIYGYNWAWAIEENIITNNLFTANLRGIDIVGRKNTIIGNTIEESTDYGILIYTGELNTISGNTVCQNEKHGIYLRTTNQNVVANNIVIDNDINNTASYSGIYVYDDANRNVIKGNICYNNDKYEIHIANSTCDKNIVANNVCYGTDHLGAIQNDGTGTVLDNNIVD